MILLAVFSVLWIFLGWYWGKDSKDLDDFMLGGRNVGVAMGVATAMATWVTSNTTMVAPQLAYQLGIWGMLGYSLGSIGLILFAPLAVRIKKLIPNGHTSGDFMRLRYGKIAWRTFLVISLFYSIGWLVSLGMAAGVLLESLSGIPYEIGLTVILSVCVAYTMLGGLKAVIGTDFIQTIIIVAGVSALGWYAIDTLSLETVYQKVSERNSALLNLAMPAGIMFLFNNLFFGVGEIFHSNVWWSRSFAFSKKTAFRSFSLAGIFWAPIPIAAGFIAFVAFPLEIGIPQADSVGPLVASFLLAKTGSILVFVIVFSSLASSLDSLLAATSDLILTDIYHKHMRPNATKTELRKKVPYVIIILGLVTYALCLPRLSNLAQLLHFTGAFVASTIWPIVFGLFFKKANSKAATWAMILGSGFGLLGYFAIGFYTAALISAAVSLLVTLIGYLRNKVDFQFENLKEKEI